MNNDPAFERATRDWLEAGSDRTPPPVIEAVVLAVRTTPQERDLRIPWRTTGMSNLLRLAAGIAIIAVVGFAGLNFLGRGGTGGQHTSPPSAVASPSPVASPSALPTPAPAPTLDLNPSTWTSVTSARYGVGYKVPPHWTTLLGKAPWIWRAQDPRADDYDTTIGPARTGLTVVSQAIPSRMSTSDWLAQYSYSDSHGGTPPGCFHSDISQYETTSVVGQPGYLFGGPTCNITGVLVITGGRAYELIAWVNLDTAGHLGKVVDPEFFSAWLSTFQFDPASADDSPAASPAPS